MGANWAAARDDNDDISDGGDEDENKRDWAIEKRAKKMPEKRKKNQHTERTRE